MCQYVLCLDNENEISDIFTMLSYFMFHNKNKNTESEILFTVMMIPTIEFLIVYKPPSQESGKTFEDNARSLV